MRITLMQLNVALQQKIIHTPVGLAALGISVVPYAGHFKVVAVVPFVVAADAVPFPYMLVTGAIRVVVKCRCNIVLNLPHVT